MRFEDQQHTFMCMSKDCGSTFTGTFATMESARWYLPRGSSPRYAYCPTHLPKKVGESRVKKEAADAYGKAWERNAKYGEKSREIFASNNYWKIEAQWPTAWTNNVEYYEKFKAEAFELSGAVVGGGIMTGAPLYNSPTTLTAVFSEKASAQKFANSLSSWLLPQSHSNCDVRFYEIKLMHHFEETLTSSKDLTFTKG